MRDLAIRLENRPGALAEMGEALGSAGVSVEGGGAFVFDGKGIAHFLVEDTVVARKALEDRGIEVLEDWDRHSAKLWDAANAIEPVGTIFGFIRIGRIQTSSNLIAVLGLALLFAGIIVRWTAIYTLGKYFTGTVLIKKDHRLIRSGLYKHLRHPAYTGTLLAHLGLGLSFSNWISVGLSSVPYCVAALYRIHVEERALRETFGEAYIRYSTDTKRLIPKLY